MASREALDAAVENAAAKLAEAKTPEEASQWQGIINQSITAIRNLDELSASEGDGSEGVNLSDKQLLQ